MKLPMYPAAACLRTGGWLGAWYIFHKWSKKASAKPYKKRFKFCFCFMHLFEHAREVGTYQPEAAQVEHVVLHMTGSVSGKHHLIKHGHQVSVESFGFLNI